jgi:hypothetical protein
MEAAIRRAAALDTQVQSATPEQQRFLQALARRATSGIHGVPSALWVQQMLYAVEGVTGKDLDYLSTLDWKPENVTAETVRQSVQKALKHRVKGGDAKAGPEPATKAPPETGTGRPPEKSAATTPPPSGRSPVDAQKTSPRRPEETKARTGTEPNKPPPPKARSALQKLVLSLQKRSQNFDWKTANPGKIHYKSTADRDSVGQTITVSWYSKEPTKDGIVRGTADLRGRNVRKAGRKYFHIEGASPFVTTDGKMISGNRLVGHDIPIH